MHDIGADKVRSNSPDPAPFLSLLIIDDYEITRTALARLISLSLPDATVHVADDYEAGIDLCSRLGVEVVITDLRRAARRASNIFERISRIDGRIRLVLLTGSSDKAELAGVSGLAKVTLLEKPVDVEVLLEAIRGIAREKAGELLSI